MRCEQLKTIYDAAVAVQIVQLHVWLDEHTGRHLYTAAIDLLSGRYRWNYTAV